MSKTSEPLKYIELLSSSALSTSTSSSSTTGLLTKVSTVRVLLQYSLRFIGCLEAARVAVDGARFIASATEWAPPGGLRRRRATAGSRSRQNARSRQIEERTTSCRQARSAQNIYMWYAYTTECGSRDIPGIRVRSYSTWFLQFREFPRLRPYR